MLLISEHNNININGIKKFILIILKNIYFNFKSFSYSY